jgi:hypothetical protein
MSCSSIRSSSPCTCVCCCGADLEISEEGDLIDRKTGKVGNSQLHPSCASEHACGCQRFVLL